MNFSIIFSHNKKSSRAFTLVEILTSIAILMVVMLSVMAFQYNVMDYNRHSQDALTNTYDAQNILKTIARELRAMTASANGSYPINVVATSSLTFYSDLDDDGFAEQIRYYLSKRTLYRGVTKSSGTPPVYLSGNEKTKILATGVRNAVDFPVFEYYSGEYDGAGNAMGYPINIVSIRMIKVNLNIDTNPDKSPLPRTFSTSVTLRNLKDNL